MARMATSAESADDALATRTASRRELITSHPEVACEVCGRRLLRGERPDSFFADARLIHVCELCTDRARQAGWVRAAELSGPPREAYRRSRRSRTLLERLRRGRAGGNDRPNRSTNGVA